MKRKVGLFWLIFFCMFCINVQAEIDISLKLKERLIGARTDTARANIYNDLAKYYREFDHDSAYYFAFQAEKLSQIEDYSEGVANALENFTIISYRQGNYSAAFDYIGKALEIAHSLEDPGLIGKCYNDKGLIQMDIGLYEEALQSYQQVMTLSKGPAAKDALARATLNVGAILWKLNDRENAIQHFKDALKMGFELESDIIILSALNNMGAHFEAEQKYDSALQFYEEARELSRKGNNYYKLATITHNIGLAHLGKNELQVAQRILNESLKLGEEYQLPRVISASYGSMGELYYKMGDFQKGANQANKGYQVAAKHSMLDLAKKSLEQLYKCYFELGKIDSAYRYLNDYSVINDSLLAQKEDKRIQQLTISNEIERKDRLLESERQKVQFEQEQTRRLTVAFLITIALLLGLVYTWFRLHRANKQLAQHNEKIEHQHEQLTELNQIKDRIFSIISHDIRAPLNNIKGLMDILLVEALEEDERQMIAGKVKKQVQETSDIFDNLLRWSRNQLLDNQTELNSFDISQMVRETIDSFGPRSQQKQVQIISELPPRLFAYADEEMIHTVVRNLLSNAIKFSPSSETIVVSHTLRNNKIILHIQDHGVGITPTKLETIFDLKQNVSTPGTADERGTGLGLPISREFVHQNGGKMWVESQPGEGSIFSFSLPMNPQGIYIPSEVVA